MSETRRRAAAATLIASSGVFLTTEFIAAAAWSDPPYSYTHHFISNLGVHGPATAFGQYMYSPLAWVMNTGFFLFGVIALAGVLLLGVRRWPVVGTAVLLAAGGILVSLFPGSEDSGTTDYHGVGALLAFVSGNVLVILLGRAARALGVPRGTGRTMVVLGIVGLLSIVAFGATLASGAGVLIGLTERGIIYPFLAGLIALGLAVRPSRGRSDRA